MNAKEYLNQAYRLDQRISSKLEQVAALRALTQRVTASYEGEVVSRTRNVSALEDTLFRLMEAEAELNSTIDALVDLKREVYATIQKVEKPEYQFLLEMRYLCFKSWIEIADQMHLEEHYVFRVHGQALREVEKILKADEAEKKIVKDSGR